MSFQGSSSQSQPEAAAVDAGSVAVEAASVKEIDLVVAKKVAASLAVEERASVLQLASGKDAFVCLPIGYVNHSAILSCPMYLITSHY